MNITIRRLIEGAKVAEGLAVIDERLQTLRTGGGHHFFDPALQEVYPEKDFWMCIDRDIFDFVIRVEKDGDGFISKPFVTPGRRQ